jgi:hypothetical protein
MLDIDHLLTEFTLEKKVELDQRAVVRTPSNRIGSTNP